MRHCKRAGIYPQLHQHSKKCSSMESLFALRARRDLPLASGWQVVVSVDSPLHHWRSHSLLDRHRPLDCPQRRRWASISSVCQRELSVQQADKVKHPSVQPFQRSTFSVSISLSKRSRISTALHLQSDERLSSPPLGIDRRTEAENYLL